MGISFVETWRRCEMKNRIGETAKVDKRTWAAQVATYQSRAKGPGQSRITGEGAGFSNKRQHLVTARGTKLCGNAPADIAESRDEYVLYLFHLSASV